MIIEQNYLNENGYKVYLEYMAIKKHFNSSYDYFKYNGKTRASYESFLARRDAYGFQKLSKKKDYKNFILANAIEDKRMWINSLLEDKADQIYFEWKKRNDAITFHVKDSLSKLKDDFKLNFIINDGNYPHIIDLYLQKEISIEVLCILTKITNSKVYWEKTIVDKVIFPDIMNKIDKYLPFIVYSEEKIKKVIKDHFF
jgi:hypothetical protein